jgi:putative nucleotidyltransferase with HDIG domain
MCAPDQGPLTFHGHRADARCRPAVGLPRSSASLKPGRVPTIFSGTMDITDVLIAWRNRPAAAVAVAMAVAIPTAVVVASGGPPSPVTHLFYVAVVVASVLWGPGRGIAVGAVCGILAEPGARALLGSLDALDDRWLVRAAALMLVGWACGSLTRSLLRRVEDLEALNRETIFAFVRAIDARDPYTARHSEKVASYAVQLAHALGLPTSDCERIRLAGLLHDVGKVALERSVLHKPGKLTDDEWIQVRRHPTLSAHIIAGVGRFAAFLPGVREHHERYDGTGYPDGLAGDDISLDGRILAIADAYDAMTSDRSYRAALGHSEAISRIRDAAGSQFDPALVEAFCVLELDPTVVGEALVPMPDLGELSGVASGPLPVTT